MGPYPVIVPKEEDVAKNENWVVGDAGSTNGTCRKCGCASYSYMTYDSAQDNLKISCKRCGFVWWKDPLDKK